MLKINEYFYHLEGKDLFVQKNHSHNEIEFIQVINGNGLVLKNDKTFLLQSHHIYVIDARNAHIVYPQSDNCEGYVRNKIVIDADSFMNFFAYIGMEKVVEELFNSPPVSTAENPEIDEIYKTVVELCNSKKSEDEGFAHGYLIKLIHWIYSNSKTELHRSKDTFQKMLDVINEKEGLTSLEEISKALYMDKHYLCHLFREKTGTTLSGYLSDKIFEKSCKLLQGTLYSIEEISAMCGFSSPSSLTRFFKKKSGMTPSEYKKERELVLKISLTGEKK